jgi:hypothetical protein
MSAALNWQARDFIILISVVEKTAETVMNTEVYNNKNQRIDTRRFNAARDYLWPIPSLAIQDNKNLVQNPGYGN